MMSPTNSMQSDCSLNFNFSKKIGKKDTRLKSTTSSLYGNQSAGLKTQRNTQLISQQSLDTNIAQNHAGSHTQQLLNELASSRQSIQDKVSYQTQSSQLNKRIQATTHYNNHHSNNQQISSLFKQSQSDATNLIETKRFKYLSPQNLKLNNQINTNQNTTDDSKFVKKQTIPTNLKNNANHNNIITSSLGQTIEISSIKNKNTLISGNQDIHNEFLKTGSAKKSNMKFLQNSPKGSPINLKKHTLTESVDDKSNINNQSILSDEKEAKINQLIAKKPLFQAAYISSKDSNIEREQSSNQPQVIVQPTNLAGPMSKMIKTSSKLTQKQIENNNNSSSSYHTRKMVKKYTNNYQAALVNKSYMGTESIKQQPKSFIDSTATSKMSNIKPFQNTITVERLSMPNAFEGSPRGQSHSSNLHYTETASNENNTSVINKRKFFDQSSNNLIENCLKSPKSNRSLINQFSDHNDTTSISRNRMTKYVETQISSNTLNNLGGTQNRANMSTQNIQSDQFDLSQQSSIITGIDTLSQKQSSNQSNTVQQILGECQRDSIISNVQKAIILRKSKLMKKRSNCECIKQQYFDMSLCENCLKWIQIINNKTRKVFDYQAIKKRYEALNDADMIVIDENQIQRDLFRTFPDISYFSKDGEGSGVLNRVLINLCKLDQNRGYIQGMNFLSACLLLHSDEVIAFYLLETLLSDYELKDVYMSGFEGLYKHCKIVDALLKEKLPNLQQHFKDNQVEVEMFSSDWFISLFTSTIPLSQTTRLFNLIFRDSWIGVYKIILIILRNFESKLLATSEACDILVALKNSEMFLQNLHTNNEQQAEIYWERIFNDAECEYINIDERFVGQLRIKYKIK
eukprot:403352707